MKAIRRYFSGIRRMMYPLSALVILVISDGVLTNVLVSDGLAREANPFLVPLVGAGSFLALKVAGALFCALLLWDIYRRQPRMALVGTYCIAAAYGGIVVWNLSMLLTAQA